MTGAWMVGIDTGGTFTDLIAVEPRSGTFRLCKVPSVPDDPSSAVLDALEELFATGIDPADVALLVHGTTVATNALLEAKGARAGLLVTRGFRAIYEARGWSQPNATDLIDPLYKKPAMLVSQYLTEEVTERLDYHGDVLVPLDEDDVRRAVRALRAKGAETLAVCLLFSYVSAAHERRIAEIVSEEVPEWRVSLSSTVLPVIREYPRLSTTVIDAYVGPIVERYLVRLGERLNERSVTTPQRFLMQSNGGLMRLSIGARFPNQTLLSGPAAGVVAATELGRLTGARHLITLDMGGTSTDISVIVDGQVLETSEGRIAGQDIASPMLKVRTLGAGGGTIAWIGRDGLLKVGPRSAGAVPGPACYMRGGDEPTVTDANLVLGALSAGSPLAGKYRLDGELAERAIRTRVAEPLGLDLVDAAAGIVRIVNTNMAVDLRLALQEEGQDPRRFALVAFGGAGPLHAAQLARDLKIPRVLVPPYPGINCATGLLQTTVKHSYLRSTIGLLDSFPVERMQALFAELEAQALGDVAEEGFARAAVVLRRQIDLRYLHQGYQLTIDVPVRDVSDADKPALKAAFDALHRRIYGQAADREPAEIVTFRLQAEIPIDRFTFVAADEERAGDASQACEGTRPLYDLDRRAFVEATVYDRARFVPGDRFPGPAIVNQFDATTVVLAGWQVFVDPYRSLVIEERA
ncbi:MAG TPA: hydantoinase/oxoprolinase family protein [Candidatus Lustribacter sp.]